MKLPSKIVSNLLFASAVSFGAVTANAATYNVTIDSGSLHYVYYPGGTDTTTNLTGRQVTLSISDNFTYLTYYPNNYETISGWFKTATVTNLVYPTHSDVLYSTDGTNFSFRYGSFRGDLDMKGMFDGLNWTFSYEGWDLDSTTNTSYIGTAAVPLPGSFWLFGSSLLGLVARRKFAAKS